MFDKCLFVLRNLSSLLERLCALRSRVFDRFFEAAEIAKFTSREFGEHWENLKSFRDWYSVMSTCFLLLYILICISLTKRYTFSVQK